MSIHRTGRWLLVVLAIVGLSLAATTVSAHGTDTAPDDAPPYNGTADDWAAWMGAHMGPGGVEWMEAHMGLSVEQMAEDMADGDGPERYGHDRAGPDRSSHGGYGHC